MAKSSSEYPLKLYITTVRVGIPPEASLVENEHESRLWPSAMGVKHLKNIYKF